jgi:hypothetical protein
MMTMAEGKRQKDDGFYGVLLAAKGKRSKSEQSCNVGCLATLTPILIYVFGLFCAYQTFFNNDPKTLYYVRFRGHWKISLGSDDASFLVLQS